jgi:hypothetical protein
MQVVVNKNSNDLNRKGVVEKITNLLKHNYDYVWMKLFSRIYFFKRFFLFFNRLGQISKLTKINTPTDEAVELREGASIEGIVADLHKQGCSEKIRLSRETLSNIIDFAMNTRSYAYGDPKHGFYLSEKEDCENKLQKDILLAKYFNFQEEKVFNNLINSSILDNIATKYLGRGAKNIATQLWWTFPADVDTGTRSKAAHFFHRDVDAWGFVKFFFYLTDVGKGGGPHVYVKYSHKPSLFGQIFKEKLRINRQLDTSIIKRFGNEAVSSFYGSSGAGLAVDTFGFHKGESPDRAPRLLVCAVYATKDYGEQEFKVDSKELRAYNYV